MKKLYLIILIILQTNKIFSQIDSNDYKWNMAKRVFTGLNISKIESGYLEDFNLLKIPLNRLNGKNDTVLNLSSVEMIYSHFNSMNIKNRESIAWDTIKTVANSYTEMGINPFLVFSQSYQKIKSGAFEAGLIDTFDGKFIDISTSSNTPYITERVFLVSPWDFSLGMLDTVKFCLPRKLVLGDLPLNNVRFYLNLPNNKMEILLDSIYNLKLINSNLTPGFASHSEVWYITAETDPESNGDIIDLKGSFEVGIIESITNFPGFFWEPIEANQTWQDKTAKGLIVYRFGKGNPDNCIRKPFIFIDGIDFGYKNDPNWSKCLDGKCNANGFIDIYTGIDHNREENRNDAPIPEFLNGKLFFDKLFDDGYDVIFLDFENGADYIQRNAMLLVKLIQDINQKKCTKEEIVICGASMGGQVARYALLYMEKHKIKHCVRNSIYFDSPHKGANIPLGLQLFMEYFANHNYGGIFNSCIDNLNRKINRPASKQLLVHHVSSGINREACWEHFDFFNEVKNMGDFPKYCRKVAIPSGSSIGTKLDFSDGELLFDMKVPIRMKETFSNIAHTITFPFHILHGFAEGFSLKSMFNALPGNSTDSYLIYKADGDGRGNMQLFRGHSGMLNWDNMPGGRNNGIDALNLSDRLFGRLIYQAGSSKALSTTFISTNSSLSLYSNDFNANVSNLIFDSEKPNTLLYPFDAFYNETFNQNHVQLTTTGGNSNSHQGNVGWTLWEVNRSANLVSDLPSSVSYISTRNLITVNTQSNSYNYSDNFRVILNSINVYSNGILGVNMNVGSNFGFKDDFNNPAINSFVGAIKTLHSSECGAEVEINDGGIFQLGDQNQPVNNKAHVFFRDGSYLRLYKGSKLIIHNGSKLIIEPGATLYIDAENVIQLEGPDAVIEIQGALVVKPGVNLKLTQQGFIKFATGADGISHIKLDLDPASAVELSSQTNDKRLEIGPGLMIEWPRQVSVKLDGIQADIGNNSGMVFNGPVDLHYVEFYGGAKSNSIVIHTPDQNNIHISGCYFGNFKTGLDFTNTSQYTTLTIDKCQFDQCNVGIQSDSMGLNLTHCSFNGCTTGWKANKVNHPSELYYTHFYMNDNMLDYTANVSRAELLFSWVTATNAGLKVNQTINANAKMSMRCSNFKNGSFDISGVRLNLSTLETHASLNSQNQPSLVHAGKNVFDNTPIYINSLWSFILENGKNDFTGHSGQPYIVGTIENARFSGNLNINDNYIKNFQQGQNVVLGYIKSGNIKYTILATTSGTLAASQFGGCSGSGGVDGDGLKPEFAAPQITQSGISCFPNPASHELNIVSNDFNYSDIRLLDVNGRTLKEYTATEDGTIPKVLDISWLPPGLYVLVVSDDNGNFKSQKFAISR